MHCPITIKEIAAIVWNSPTLSLDNLETNINNLQGKNILILNKFSQKIQKEGKLPQIIPLDCYNTDTKSRVEKNK